MGQMKLLLRGSALRTTEALVAIVAGFITLPIMNHHLGTELYGLWVLIGSVTAMMYLFDMGFASAVTQKIAYTISQHDHQKANGVISTALAIYTTLALIVALIVALIAMNFEPNLKGLMTLYEFRMVIILSGLAMAIEFPAKAFAGLAQAHFRHDLVALNRILFKIAATVTLIVLLVQGYKIIAVATMGLIFSVLGTLAFTAVGRYVYKQMSLSWRYISRDIFKELFSYSAWAFLIDLNRVLKSRIDLFFIGAYISLTAVTVYYVAVRLVDYAAELLHKMLSITLPTLTAHIASGNKNALREDLLLFNRINTYAYALAVVMFAALGKTVIYYWLGSDFDYDTAYVILMVIALGRISIVAVDGYITSLYAKSQHKLLVFSGLTETILTALILYVFLARLGYGSLYAAIAIALPIFLLRFLFVPWLCQKHLELPQYKQLVWLSYRPALLILIGFAIQSAYGVQTAMIGYQKLLEVVTIALVCIIFMVLESQPREKEIAMRLIGNAKSLLFKYPRRAK